MSKNLVFVGNSYVCWKNEDISAILWFATHDTKNVIKGIFSYGVQKF